MSLLAVDRLRLVYDSGRASTVAIEEATLSVAEGEAVGLVGESGSGKSSLARALLGLLPAGTGRITDGSISIAGRDVTRLSRRDWEKLRGRPATEHVRGAATWVGLLFLASLMIFVIYLGVVRWIWPLVSG